jgi:hypothetical protein
VVGGLFLFWDRSRNKPLVVYKTGAKPALSALKLDVYRGRSPVIAADLYGGKAMLLDSMGNITVIAVPPQPQAAMLPRVIFSYEAPGTLDAAFAGENRVITARTASGGSPFVVINTLTGETVPIPWQADLALKVESGKGGIYGAVLKRKAASSVPQAADKATELVKLDIANPAASLSIAQSPGEVDDFLVCGLGDRLITTLSGEDADLYTAAGQSLGQLERSPGLPLRIAWNDGGTGGGNAGVGGNAGGNVDGKTSMVTADSAGNIVFYDEDLKLKAVLRFYGSRWELTLPTGSVRRGKVVR